MDPARQRRTGIIVTLALVLVILGLLAWGLKKCQARPRDRGKAPDFTITATGAALRR
jgi:hypothetical protein